MTFFKPKPKSLAWNGDAMLMRSSVNGIMLLVSKNLPKVTSESSMVVSGISPRAPCTIFLMATASELPSLMFSPVFLPKVSRMNV